MNFLYLAAAFLLQTASASSTTSSDTLVSYDDFVKAWKASEAIMPIGSPQPTQTQYQNFINNAGPIGSITSKTELAMFLTQMFYSSGNLMFKNDMNAPPGINYGSAPGRNDPVSPNQDYHGRGYVMLTWAGNYSQVSQDIFKDTSLWSDPGKAASDDLTAWKVSLSYWKLAVKPALAANANAFGATTNALHGSLYCGPGALPNRAQTAFKIYKSVLAVFDSTAVADNSGC